MKNRKIDRPVIIVTDFGPDSAKGRVLGALDETRRKHHSKYATILDQVHSVPSFQVWAGSFEIAEEAGAWGHRQPVILGVVDPGVGTERDPIAIQTKDGITFVGPNNGLAHHLLQQHAAARAVIIGQEHRRIPATHSATFDGRDLFAVAAAKLSAGVPLDELGDPMPVERLEELSIPPGGIVHIDTVSGIPKFEDVRVNGATLLEHLRTRDTARLPTALTIDRSGRTENVPFAQERTHHRPVHFGRTFGEVPPGEIVGYAGSSGTPEIAVNLRNTRETLNLGIGDVVRFEEEM